MKYYHIKELYPLTRAQLLEKIDDPYVHGLEKKHPGYYRKQDLIDIIIYENKVEWMVQAGFGI